MDTALANTAVIARWRTQGGPTGLSAALTDAARFTPRARSRSCHPVSNLGIADPGEDLQKVPQCRPCHPTGPCMVLVEDNVSLFTIWAKILP
jgi:hypothetical protein